MTTESNTAAMSEQSKFSPVRELRDDELDAATGGLVVLAIIQPLVGLLLSAVNNGR